jgi:hypothetical protein
MHEPWPTMTDWSLQEQPWPSCIVVPDAHMSSSQYCDFSFMLKIFCATSQQPPASKTIYVPSTWNPEIWQTEPSRFLKTLLCIVNLTHLRHTQVQGTLAACMLYVLVGWLVGRLLGCLLGLTIAGARMLMPSHNPHLLIADSGPFN